MWQEFPKMTVSQNAESGLNGHLRKISNRELEQAEIPRCSPSVKFPLTFRMMSLAWKKKNIIHEKMYLPIYLFIICLSDAMIRSYFNYV